MQYRNFGKLSWKASALGFGCMRLPTISGMRNAPDIDEPEAQRMLRRAIDNGINYIDTAYVYHEGNSEFFLGRALKDGYREKVKLATKLPVWEVKEPGDFDRLLDEQLKKIQTDHIDFYLFHALDKVRWENIVLKHNLLAKAEAAIADGRIGHIGFSVHEEYAGFEQIVNGSDLWSFCQIQYNYMDTENQAGMRGLKLAASKGLAVVIMEPLLGGRLTEPPQDIRDAMEHFPVRRSPAAWALEWLWDQPEVSLVLSGMSTMAQVEENLNLASQSCTGAFTAEDQSLIDAVRQKYKARTAIPCTKCAYCMPCPNGVNIPGNFEFFNYASLYEDIDGARFRYNVFLTEEQRASACLECAACEELCPQKIPISSWMPKVAAKLG